MYLVLFRLENSIDFQKTTFQNKHLLDLGTPILPRHGSLADVLVLPLGLLYTAAILCFIFHLPSMDHQLTYMY